MATKDDKVECCHQHKRGVSPGVKRIYTPWCPMCRMARAAGKFTMAEIAEGLVESKKRQKWNPPFRRQRKPTANQKRVFARKTP